MQRTRHQRPAATTNDGVRERLHALFAAAHARARSLGGPVLASSTERVRDVRPLDALQPGRGVTQMYCATPADGFAIAGIGNAAELRGTGADRFAEVSSAWERLITTAVVHDATNAAMGGPVLMGGFSFDPDGPRSARWRGFGAASFIVPRCSVARRNGDTLLTMNALVNDDDVGGTIEELLQLREQSLAPADASPPTPRSTSPSTPLSTSPSTPPLTPPSTPPSPYEDLVRDAVRAIQDRRFEKVVLAREVTASLPPGLDVVAALRYLTSRHPATFIYGVWRDDAVFFGASPERLVRLHGRDVSTSVLAGSWPRGDTPDADARNAAALLASAKDRDEHEIVRRDIEAALMPVCDAVVTDLAPSVVSLAHVHHLHTAVRARLEDGRTVFDVVERLHPTPAVGGAPKQAALEFIRKREDVDRGWYASPVGWVSTAGAEFAVALRCSLVRRARASLFAGCGIVAQSDPATEFEESQAKLRAAREALDAGAVEPAATRA